MHKPLVSVIVPVYNGEEYLLETLHSIYAQNYSPFEMLVVDDGSTDNTPHILKSFQGDLRIIRQGNQGLSRARNRGLKEANGDLISFIDADDLWPIGRLSQMVHLILKNSDIKAIRGQARLFSVSYDKNPLLDRMDLLPWSVNRCLYQRGVFDQVGLFDPNIPYGEDLDWFIRAQNCGIVYRDLDDIVLFVRRHANNMTRARRPTELGMLRALKKKIDKR